MTNSVESDGIDCTISDSLMGKNICLRKYLSVPLLCFSRVPISFVFLKSIQFLPLCKTIYLFGNDY